MASEEIFLITPGKHKFKVRLNDLGDDAWDTTIVYVGQPHRVGKFKGKDRALEAAKKKAIQIADAPPTTGSIICEDDSGDKKTKKS
jgi:hypothetical protein